MKSLPWKFLLLVFAVVLAITYPATRGQLLNYDDERYITANPFLSEQAPEESVFTAYFDGHYHPLTLLSLQVDQALGKDYIRAHHVGNWLLHGLNAALLYLFLLGLTKNQSLSLFAALLFGVHPVAVESYAWMTERKNVLYTAFFLLALISYLRESGKGFPLLTLVFFTLSCLSKAQAIVLVPVLFMLDLLHGKSLFKATTWLPKVPFLALALLFTWLSNQAQTAMWDLNNNPYSLGERILLGGQAFLLYLRNLVFPVNLSPYYPYPVDLGAPIPTTAYLGWALLAATAWACWYSWRKGEKTLAFLLVFFLLNLLPLLKILPIPYGNYIAANRYAYLPMAALLPALLLVAFQQMEKRQLGKPLYLGAALVVLFAFFCRTELKKWNNSVDLWTAVIDHYPTYAEAYNFRALGHVAAGNVQAAVADFSSLSDLSANKPDGPLNLSILYSQMGQTQKAQNALQEASKRAPNNDRVLSTKAQYLMQDARYNEALELYNRALENNPSSTAAQLGKVRCLINLGNLQPAKKLLTSMPPSKEVTDLLNLCEQLLRTSDGMETIKRQQAKGLIDRGINLSKAGEFQKAKELFDQAVELVPNYHVVYVNRASNAAQLKDYPAALADYEKALEINPKEWVIHAMLGALFTEIGNTPMACLHYRTAKENGIQLPPEALQLCGL